MSNLQRVRRGVFVTLLVAGIAAPVQAAEPLTLFLLKMLRDQMATSVLESAVNALPGPKAVAPAAPAALAGVHGVDEAQLRGLIDAGFVHLSTAQRNEIYASLTRMLADPKNALARPLIIQELAERASAVRGAHERLAALNATQKRATSTIAVRAPRAQSRLPTTAAARRRTLGTIPIDDTPPFLSFSTCATNAIM